MTDFFKGDVTDVWGADASAYTLAMNPALYSFAVPIGLNDQLSLNEMETLIEEYLIYINTEQLLNEGNLEDAAKKARAFIQHVQNSGYEPDRIIFRYIAPKASKDNRGLIIVGIGNWQEIMTVEQVMEQLKSNLAE